MVTAETSQKGGDKREDGLAQVPGITDERQVRFQPPDQDWRTVISSLGVQNALNIYLLELRENRKLRTNERVREITNGMATDTPAPRRIDCHYLITAWSPASVTASIEPTVDEHALLYEVTAVLMNHESLVPRKVYAPDPLPAGFPELITDVELPMTILPVENFPKYAEFWGTMGNIHPWKPAVYVVITLPVALQKEIAGPLITTRITEYRQSGLAETAESWVQIGGTVRDKAGNATSGAWVRLETTTGETLQTTETNALGRFSFGGLRPGRYQLRVRAEGLGEQIRQNVDVPSLTGEYDVRYK